MIRKEKCNKCGSKQDYPQMNRCFDCKKYYCDKCVIWHLADEYYGNNVKYYLKCPVCNRSLGTDWKSIRDDD